MNKQTIDESEKEQLQLLLRHTLKKMTEFVVNFPNTVELGRVTNAKKGLEAQSEKMTAAEALSLDDIKHLWHVCSGISYGFTDCSIEFSSAIAGQPFFRAFQELSHYVGRLLEK